MATPGNPIAQDPAEPILRGEPQIDDESKASLWDAFHSKNADELTQHLAPLAIPDDTKKRLIYAKQQMTPPPPPANPVQSAVSTMAAMPPEQLDLAEQHPNLLKALVESLKPAEKEDYTEKESAKVPLTPRIDGKPHLPAIKPSHFRIMASDGGLHDLPKANIDRARAIDPLLHVLNPD